MAHSNDEILRLLAASADVEQDPTNASKLQAFSVLLDSVRREATTQGWQPPQVLQTATGEPLLTRLRVVKTAGVPISERFELSRLSLVLYIRPQGDVFALIGTIEPIEAQQAADWIGAEVEVYSAETVVSTAQVDQHLEFECAPLVPAGQFELRVFSTTTQQVIVTGQIELT